MACAIDLAEEESVRDLCAITRERFGRIDILHNNAADTRISQMAADAAIEDMDCGIWDRAFTLNVRGTMLMIKHCVHSMIEMGHGSIINIGSGVSVLGDLFNPAYSTSKGAVNTLTRNVAASLANEAFDAMPFFRALFLPHTQKK